MIFEILEYEATPKTPHVYFNGNKGILNIEGRCIPEDASKFFEELHSFFDRYRKSPNYLLKMSVYLEYFNTASARELMKLFRRLEEFPSEIAWYYDKGDIDMLEAGNDFYEILQGKVPLFLLEKEK